MTHTCSDEEMMIGMDEVAMMAGVSRRHAEAMLATGTLPRPVRWGRLRRWHRGVVAEWLRAQAEAAAGPRDANPHRGPGRPRTGVSQ